MRRDYLAGLALYAILAAALVLTAGAVAQADDTPAPQPQAPKASEVGIDWKAAGLLTVDLSRHSPRLAAAECMLGPHYGPVFIGGVCATQDATVSAGVPLVTYVAQGKFHGWFKGLAITLLARRVTNSAGTPSVQYSVGVGAAR